MTDSFDQLIELFRKYQESEEGKKALDKIVRERDEELQKLKGPMGQIINFIKMNNTNLIQLYQKGPRLGDLEISKGTGLELSVVEKCMFFVIERIHRETHDSFNI